MVITVQCTATVSRSIVLPRILGITRTWICRLNFAQRPIFSGLRFFNEPEISESGHQLKVPPGGLVLRMFTSWKNPSTSVGFEPANLGSRGEHVTTRPPKPTINFSIWCYIVNERPIGIQINRVYWMGRRWNLEVKVILIFKLFIAFVEFFSHPVSELLFRMGLEHCQSVCSLVHVLSESLSRFVRAIVTYITIIRLPIFRLYAILKIQIFLF